MLRIDLNKEYAIRAFDAAIASLKRSKAKLHNPAMAAIIDQDIYLYQVAISTMTETSK